MRWLKRRRASAGPDSTSTAVASWPDRLETADLVLQPVTAADTAALLDLWNEVSLRAELWDGRVLSPGQARDLVERSEREHAATGLGLWAGRDARGELAGFCGYSPFLQRNEIELMYGVAPAHRLCGHARQMAAALVEYGFAVVGLKEIRATTGAENIASQRVLKRLGFVAEAPLPGAAKLRFFRHRPVPATPRDTEWEAA